MNLATGVIEENLMKFRFEKSMGTDDRYQMSNTIMLTCIRRNVWLYIWVNALTHLCMLVSASETFFAKKLFSIKDFFGIN